jgi:transforming growth factor-beta-induced protein
VVLVEETLRQIENNFCLLRTDTLLQSTNLNATLKSAGRFTLFAPTNDAFALLNPSIVAALTPAQLTNILLYHVLPSRVSSINLGSLKRSWPTVQGASLTVVSGPAGSVVVDFGRVTVSIRDIQCTNGVVHVIDRVLLPPASPTIAQLVKSDTDLSTLGTCFVLT